MILYFLFVFIIDTVWYFYLRGWCFNVFYLLWKKSKVFHFFTFFLQKNSLSCYCLKIKSMCTLQYCKSKYSYSPTIPANIFSSYFEECGALWHLKGGVGPGGEYCPPSCFEEWFCVFWQLMGGKQSNLFSSLLTPGLFCLA